MCNKRCGARSWGVLRAGSPRLHFLTQHVNSRAQLDGDAMVEMDEQTLQDQLKTKLDSLHKELRKNPSNTRLALEIKLIDDLIASLSKYLVTQKAGSSGV